MRGAVQNMIPLQRLLLGFVLILMLFWGVACQGGTATIEETTTGNQYLTEEKILEKAKKLDSTSKVKWSAKLVENKQVIINNKNETRTIWIVEALYTAGNKMIVEFDAITGQELALTEIEAPDNIESSKISNCLKVTIPSDKEVNTNVDKEKKIIEASWYDETKGKDVTVTIRYTDDNCSESVKKLISQVVQ